jgi:hypothetical protein
MVLLCCIILVVVDSPRWDLLFMSEVGVVDGNRQLNHSKKWKISQYG